MFNEVIVLWSMKIILILKVILNGEGSNIDVKIFFWLYYVKLWLVGEKVWNCVYLLVFYLLGFIEFIDICMEN